MSQVVHVRFRVFGSTIVSLNRKEFRVDHYTTHVVNFVHDSNHSFVFHSTYVQLTKDYSTNN